MGRMVQIFFSNDHEIFKNIHRGLGIEKGKCTEDARGPLVLGVKKHGKEKKTITMVVHTYRSVKYQ